MSDLLCVINQFLINILREIALAVKGKSIEKAREFLDDVLSKKIAVPYRRYHNEVAHRSNIRDGFCSGRYPQ